MTRDPFGDNTGLAYTIKIPVSARYRGGLDICENLVAL